MPESNDQTVEPSGIGQWLLSQREDKGVSLEEAADVTRISKNYLIALESEDFGKLPGPAYCKGFLRIYAGYLGLSPDDAVKRYEMAFPGSVAPVQRAASEEKPRTSDGPVKPRRSWALTLTLLLVVILLSIFIDTDQRPALRRPSPESGPVNPAQTAPVLAVRTSAQKAASFRNASSGQPLVSSPAPQSVSPPEPMQKGVILKLKINQDSWLNVDIDGIISKQYELKAGDLIEWKADSVITLDVGNAGGVEGELNGKPIPALGPVGKKAHAVLRPEGAVLQ